MSYYPITRPRRLRKSAVLRQMVQETHLLTEHLIYPLFIEHGRGIRTEISSMPGQFRLSVDQLADEAKQLQMLGIPAVMLFGIPATKDAVGIENFADDGIIQQAIGELKAAVPTLIIITDVCLCEYTSHGHCGVLDSDGQILNDETIEILGKVAISHAQAGADIVAPSGMLDGMVGAIRHALDKHHYINVSIMSYAVKYASAYYGPFREAADGVPEFGDRRTHQMNPANKREAMREAMLDVAEGADFLMVKPALAYLDIVQQVNAAYPQLPMVAYNVSGEYSMVKAAAANGWLDEKAVVLETLMGMRRAGADLIISYHAKEAAKWLNEGEKH